MSVHEKDHLLGIAVERSDNPLVALGMRVGATVLKIVLDELGGGMGEQLYIPNEKNFYTDLKRKERRHDVWENWDFTPFGLEDMAQKWSVSPSTIRRDYREMEKE